MLRPLLLVFATLAPALGLAQACPSKMLVSGYNSNNVHIYDACTGALERTLDSTPGRLRGAQAVRIGPDGLLYVVAEETRAVQRYRADTFEFVSTAFTVPVGFDATGLAFGPNNEFWVCGYGADSVRRFSAEGQPLGELVARGTAGLNGPDNGMNTGPDGRLYIPGYDSHSLVRYDPATQQTVALIPAGSNGLLNTRGILFEPGGETMLITSEGSGKVLRFRVADGGYVGTVVSGLSVPTGMAYAPDGKLLVADAGGVSKYDIANGARLQVMAESIPGGLDGPTFVAVIPAASAVDASQVGSQYWVTGAGAISGRTLTIANTVSTTGAAFGSAFDPAQVAVKRWGAMTIEFTSCREGTFRWDSTGADSAGFGTGSYPIVRLLPNELTAECERVGFANANAMTWIVGSWYGGASRNGEGFLIDKTADGVPFVAWFTYRPR